MNQSPIVITGMHRSGTSLISEILLNNEVNLGSQLDINYESIYFQRINNGLCHVMVHHGIILDHSMI